MEQSATDLDGSVIEQLQACALDPRPKHSASCEVLRQVIIDVATLASSKKLTSAEVAHARRLAAIMSVHCMWKDDVSKPKDAVEYQRKIRAEW